MGFLHLAIEQTYRAYKYEQLSAYPRVQVPMLGCGDNINAVKFLISSLLVSIDRKN